jgi:dTDP-glucose 4,6-dehydratase
MSDLLVLGGSGFVGVSLQNELSETFNGNVTFASSGLSPRPKVRELMDRASYISWDIRESSVIPPIFETIIHAATPASAFLNTNDPAEMLNVIVQGMKNVIDFASRHSTPPTVLFTSSGAVYGNIVNSFENIREDTVIEVNPLVPTSAYAEGKRIAELMLLEATNLGICKGKIARMFAFSGKHLPRDRHFAIGNFVESAVSQQKILIRSDGLSVRSYLDECDMAKWLMAIATNGTPNQIYHVGSERALSILELAVLVAKRCELLTGGHISVDVLGQTSPIDGVSRYVPSTLQTRKLLNVMENISLESSIDSMLQAAIVDLV